MPIESSAAVLPPRPVYALAAAVPPDAPSDSTLLPLAQRDDLTATARAIDLDGSLAELSAPLHDAGSMDAAETAAFSKRYFDSALNAQPQHPLTEAERSQWWAALCGTSLGHAATALAQTEQNLQELLLWQNVRERDACWAQFSQAERRDINTLLGTAGVGTAGSGAAGSGGGGVGAFSNNQMPDTESAYLFALNLSVQNARPLLAAEFSDRLHLSVDDARAAVDGWLQGLPAQQHPGGLHRTSRATGGHALGARRVAHAVREDLTATVLRQWQPRNAQSGLPKGPSVLEGLRGILLAASAFDALRRTLIDEMFSINNASDAIRHDGFVSHNALGLDISQWIAAAEQNLGDRFVTLDEVQKASLVRQRLCEWGEHPDFPIGSVEQSMASTLLRYGNASAPMTYPEYATGLDLLGAFEARQADWLVTRREPLSPRLHAALHHALTTGVVFAKPKWWADYWQTHIVDPLRNHPRVNAASVEAAGAMWRWVARVAPGWNPTTFSWDVPSGHALVLGVEAGLDSFYRLQQPAHFVRHETLHVPMSIGAIPLDIWRYSKTLEDVPFSLRSAVSEVGLAMDTDALKTERVLSDGWMETAYRLIERQQLLSSARFQRTQKFDTHVAAYAELLDQGFEPGLMLRLSDVAPQPSQPSDVQVSLFDAFIRAARDDFLIRLPSGETIRPAALIDASFEQFSNNLNRSDALRGRALGNLLARGDVLLPSVLQKELNHVIATVQAQLANGHSYRHDVMMGALPMFPLFGALDAVGKAQFVHPYSHVVYATHALLRAPSDATRLAKVLQGEADAALLLPDSRGKVGLSFTPAIDDTARLSPAGVSRSLVSVRPSGGVPVIYSRPQAVTVFHRMTVGTPPGEDGTRWAKMMRFLVNTPLPEHLEKIAGIVQTDAKIEQRLATLSSRIGRAQHRDDSGFFGTSRILPTFVLEGRKISERPTVVEVQNVLLRAPDSMPREAAALIERHVQINAADLGPRDYPDGQPRRADIKQLLEAVYRASALFRRLLNAYDDKNGVDKTIHIASQPGALRVRCSQDPDRFHWHIILPVDDLNLPFIEGTGERFQMGFELAVIAQVVAVLAGVAPLSSDQARSERGASVWLTTEIMRALDHEAIQTPLNAHTYQADEATLVGGVRVRFARVTELEDQYIEQCVPELVTLDASERCEGMLIGQRPTVVGAIRILSRLNFTANSLATQEYTLDRSAFTARFNALFRIRVASSQSDREVQLSAFFWRCYSHSPLFSRLFDSSNPVTPLTEIFMDGTRAGPLNEAGQFSAPSADWLDAKVDGVFYAGLGDATSLTAFEPFKRVLDTVLSVLLKTYGISAESVFGHQRGPTVWCADWILSQAGWAVDKRLTGTPYLSPPQAPVQLISARVGELRRLARAEDAYIARWLSQQAVTPETHESNGANQ